MADKFSGHSDFAGDPARSMFPITPHDSNPVDPLPKAIRANTAGTVVLKAVDSSGVTVTITMAAGEVLPVRASIITTATTAALHGLA